jgi:hypothetical protein
MFEHFGETLYKSGVYELQEIEPGRVYLAEHVDAASREKWCKVAYRVEVAEDQSFFNCECGNFEHSGMICCHAVKVLTCSFAWQFMLMSWWPKDFRPLCLLCS